MERSAKRPFDVFIDREPFLTMLWASVEVYNMESLGFLLGRLPTKTHPYWQISHAIPMQRVSRRTNTCVNASKGAWSRANDFYEMTGKLYARAVGDFHSHPDLRGKTPELGLSDKDINGMKDPEKVFGPVSVVIRVVRGKSKSTQWRYLDQGTRLRGRLGKFRFDVNAYVVEIAGDGTAHERKLVVAVAPSTQKALNRAQRQKSRA